MSEDHFYEVEKILDHRPKMDGKPGLEFFLKWKDYPDSENSWEPQENVTDDLIDPYLIAVQAKAKRKSLNARKVNPSSKSKHDIRTPKTSRIGTVSSSTPDPPTSTTETVRTSGRSRKIPRRLSPEPSEMKVDKETVSKEKVSAPKQSEASEDALSYKDKKVEALFKGLDFDQIGGVCTVKDTPHFKILWKNDTKVDLIPIKTCNRIYPQGVIAYYEKHISFTDKVGKGVYEY